MPCGLKSTLLEAKAGRKIIRLGQGPSHPREANNYGRFLLPDPFRPSAADDPCLPAMRSPVLGGASIAPGPPPARQGVRQGSAALPEQVSADSCS